MRPRRKTGLGILLLAALALLLLPAGAGFADSPIKRACLLKCGMDQAKCDAESTATCTPRPQGGWRCKADVNCGDRFNSCQKRCHDMPDCSEDAQCGAGQVCEKSGPVPACVLECTLDSQCKQRLGPEARCFSGGHCGVI